MESSFTCPSCQHKLSFWKRYKAKRDETIICENCQAELDYSGKYPWGFRFYLFFLGTLIGTDFLAQLNGYSNWEAIPIALTAAFFVFCIENFFIYKNTYFKLK